MCRLLGFTNMTQVKVDAKLVMAARAAVCEAGNKDGFGFSLLNSRNQLYTERTMRPWEFQPKLGAAGKPTKTSGIELATHDASGHFHATGNKAAIFHGRMSTNSVALENTHPFTASGVALAHNGVVQNAGDLVLERQTDCDTEILLRLWQHGGMQSIEDNASGYYALLILDTTGRLHVAKDNRASLRVAYCPTIDSHIFATTPDMLNTLAKKMRWKLEEILEVRPNVYAQYDGNSLMMSRDINPIGFVTGIDSGLAAKALGSGSVADDDYESYAGYPKADAGSYRTLFERSEITTDDAPSLAGEEEAAADAYDEITREQVDALMALRRKLA